jgi:hypothetical protein
MHSQSSLALPRAFRLLWGAASGPRGLIPLRVASWTADTASLQAARTDVPADLRESFKILGPISRGRFANQQPCSVHFTWSPELYVARDVDSCQYRIVA